jgi:signal transduction histidine kinase
LSFALSRPYYPLTWEGHLPALFYFRLIVLTVGTLVYLFLLALIVGHRKPRLLERLLFFVSLAAFLIYAGKLLEINSFIQYGTPPLSTQFFYTTLVNVGIILLPGLLVAVQLAYLQSIGGRHARAYEWVLIALLGFFVPVVWVFWTGHLGVITTGAGTWLDFQTIAFRLAVKIADWVMIPAIAIAGGFQLRTARTARDPNERRFFRALFGISCISVVTLIALLGFGRRSPDLADGINTVLIVLGTLPGLLLLYFAVRRNFLEYGAQRNLVYALPATFLALLYLALVRRVGQWLEPVVPPEATASVLLFVLLFLFEPLERVIGPFLQKRFQERLGSVQKLTLELHGVARQGNVAELINQAERRIRDAFSLAAVRISVPLDPARTPLQSPGRLGHVVQIPLNKGSQAVGALEAASTGSYLTGETTASLQIVADQFPAMLDLSHLIEEKISLERELAERERLASLGQMAASVSHNLRNPLSSMKTVLQVQLENPDLPVDLRRDCALVVAEIDRMSAKLTQLLRYAKPSVNGERVAAVNLARQTAVLFRHDAERRNVRLEFEQPAGEVYALASEESLSEILSNLIVNAIEAQPDGGRVRVSLSERGERMEILVEDDGPGISPDLRANIFQPYFTTKPTGTGLGLSIVARRVDEIGGTLACESPLRNGKGTRFRLSLPLSRDPGPVVDGNRPAAVTSVRKT